MNRILVGVGMLALLPFIQPAHAGGLELLNVPACTSVAAAKNLAGGLYSEELSVKDAVAFANFFSTSGTCFLPKNYVEVDPGEESTLIASMEIFHNGEYRAYNVGSVQVYENNPPGEVPITVYVVGPSYKVLPIPSAARAIV